MFGRRSVYFGFGLMGMSVAASLFHTGADVLAIGLMVVTVSTCVPILFDAWIKASPEWRDRSKLLFEHARAVSMAAKRVTSTLLAAIVGAAGVGILALLPRGADPSGDRGRVGVFRYA